jgi:PAS domain S-box-containing protein
MRSNPKTQPPNPGASPGQIEQELRDSQARLASIIASAMDAIITVDESQRILLFNAAAEAMFGYAAAQVFGQNLGILLPERYRAQHEEHIRRFGATGVTNRTMGRLGTLYGRRASGEEFQIEASISQVQSSDGKLFTVILRDVTERVRAELALQARTEELKTMSQQLWQSAKLATMGELAASIAHELNNPLAILSLRIESLLAGLPDDSAARRELRVMEQEVDRMASLVANLLQFSRSGQRQISSLDLQKEIDKTLELIHSHLVHRRIAVRRAFDPVLPLIQADRQQLRQLFLNLFTNASDAMPEGGILTIRVASISDGRQVKIDVQDTGIGISPESLDRVMEPFYTTKSEGKGTGLGLAICRRIAEEHQGTLQISSPGPGKGTVVQITLPIQNNSKNSFLMEEA